MVIAPGGSVGIGTTGPASILNLYSQAANGDTTLRIDHGNSARGNFYLRSDNYSSTANRFIIGEATGGDMLTIMGDNNGSGGNAGYVGIGTTAPGYQLEVNGNLDIIQAQGTGANAFFRATSDASTADWSFGADEMSVGANKFIIYDRVNSAYRMTIDNAGNVGINDTTPTYKLDVNGTFRVTGAATFDSSIGFATVLAGNGTASLPSFAFTNDPNTGMYNDGANDNLKFSTGGVVRAFLTATQWNVTGNIVGVAGIFSGAVSGTTGTFTGNVAVSHGSAPHFQIQQTSGNAWRWYADATDSFIRNGTGGHNIAKFAANGDVGFYNPDGSATQFFWDSSAEKLGIGTSSPSESLHIYRGSGPEIRLQNSTRNWYLRSYGDRLDIYITGTSLQAFTILADGKIGIGATVPAVKLHLDSGATTELRIDGEAHELITFHKSSAQKGLVGYSNSDSTLKLCAGSGTIASNVNGISINANGNVGIGTATPDTKLHVYYASPSPTMASITRANLDNLGILVEDSSLDNNNGEITCGITFGYVGESSSAIASVDEGGSGASGLGFVTGTIASVAERLRITNNGNVGIGTAVPAAMLEVIARASGGHPPLFLRRGATNESASLKLLTTTTEDWIVGMRNDGTSNFRIYSYGASSDVFSILRSNGNVGIGSATPAYALDVVGYAKVSLGIKVGGGSAGNSTNPAITVGSVNTAGVYFESSGVGFGSGSGTKKTIPEI